MQRSPFQCSSASRKFLNTKKFDDKVFLRGRFQCSSASRKFLNYTVYLTARASSRCFSALQRAENSSMIEGGKRVRVYRRFSALQRAENSSMLPEFYCPRVPIKVSVLFSEPKIPQCYNEMGQAMRDAGFQCSSASRKFLNFRTR